MSDLVVQQQVGIIVFVTALMLITASNLQAWRRLGGPLGPRGLRSEHRPRVSVLVPARNEAANIRPCVASLLAQDYSDFEVIVLDDHSSDGTGAILDEMAARDGRLHVLWGAALPGGWLGKHWACEQLAQASDGELLLFTDADTRHHPAALRDAVAALLAEDADLLTALPHEEIRTWAERLVVPIIPWSLFAILPLGLAHRLRLPALAAAIGQFMLFRRSALEQIGGFASVRQQVADDLALARRVKAHGLRWRLVDGGERVTCRMYHTASEVIQGLSKNLFAAFGYRALPFVFVWAWLAVVFVEPPLVLILAAAGIPLPGHWVALAGVTAVLSTLVWAVVYRRFRVPLALALLHPVTILLVVGIAARSLVLTLGGGARWKGRTLSGEARWY